MAGVVLRNQQTGVTGEVSQEKAAELLSKGSLTGETYEPVSQAELDEIQRTNYSESGLGQLEAAGRGAVDWLGELPIGLAGRAMGATGPLPSLSSILEGAAAEATGATPLEAGQLIASEADVGRRLEQEAGFAYGAGEMLGQIATLGTGGTMGVLGRVGEGAAARAGLGRVGQLVAQSGLEGATQAAGAALMADPQRSAQSVIADAGLGALIGGMAGGALPAAGALAGRGARAAVRGVGEAAGALLPKAATEVADDLGRKGMTGGLRGMLLDAQALGTGLDRELLERVGAGGAESEIAMTAARTINKTVDDAAKTVSKNLTEASSSLDEVLGASRIADTKLNSFRRQTDEAILRDPVRIRAIEDEIVSAGVKLEEFMARAERAIENGDLSPKARGMVRSMKKQYDQALEAMPAGGDAIDGTAVLELTKRRMQRAVGAMRSSTENLRYTGKLTDFEAAELADLADSLDRNIQEPMRLALMNPDIVPPKFAEGQMEINRGYSQQGIRDMAEFRGRFMERVAGGPDYGTGRDVWRVNPASVKNALTALGRAEGELPNAALDGYLGTADNLAGLHAKHYGADMGDAYLRHAETVAENVRTARETLDYVKKQRGHADDWEQVQAAEGAGALLGSGAAMLGAVTGGIPGAVAGGVAGAALAPARTAAFVVQVAGMAKRAGVKADGLRKWVATGAKRAKAVGETVARGVTEDGRRAARATGRAARPVITSAAVRAFIGPRAMSEEERPDPRKQYREQLKRLERYRPGMVAERLSSDGTVPPQVAAALDAKAAEATRYCLERAPSAKYGGAVRPGMPYQPSSMEIDAFARMWGAAHHPQTALDDIQAGTATSQQVATVRDLYPDVYRAWQASALAGLAEADSDGIPVGIGQRAYLASVLDLDGAGDPFLTDSFGASMRSFQAMTAPQPTGAQPPPPSPLGMQAQTPAQSMLSMA